MNFKNRYKSLDFLRGIAVLLVMLEHYEVSNLFIQIGWSGVDLFFVLSGFFVSGILFREFKAENKVTPKRFLLRRGLKIWPLFYFALIMHILYYWLKETPLSSQRILADAFFYQNYREGVMGISWSLGVEEQFYLFIALFCWAVFSLQKRTVIPIMCVFLMIVCPVLRIINNAFNPSFSLMTHHFPTYFRMDSLAFGILISYFFHFYSKPFQEFVMKYRYLLLTIACSAIVPLFFWKISDYWMNTLGLTSNYISYGVFLSLFLIVPMKNKALNNSFSSPFLFWLVWIGQYSYAIYLFHFSFGFGIANFVRTHLIHQAPHLFYSVIYLISNIVIGYLVSKGIEQPFLRFRDKYIPASARTEPKNLSAMTVRV